MLYYDTDSVIYRWKEGQTEIETGDFLGEMTDELDGDTIVEFISGGPKNYAYKTKANKTECKVRGFTLNVRGREVLNYTSMKKTILAVLEGGEQEDPDDPITVRNPNHFHRDQTHKTMKLTGETRKKVSNSGLIFERSVQKNVFHAKLQQLRDPDRSPEQPEALSRGEKPLTQDELIVEVNEKSEVRWKFAGIVEQS